MGILFPNTSSEDTKVRKTKATMIMRLLLDW